MIDARLVNGVLPSAIEITIPAAMGTAISSSPDPAIGSRASVGKRGEGVRMIAPRCP